MFLEKSIIYLSCVTHHINIYYHRYILKTCLNIKYIFRSEVNFFPFRRICSFLHKYTKATLSRFSESLDSWKITKYIGKGRGKMIFTLCLKSDRKKESLRNVSDRSYPPCGRKESEAQKWRRPLWVVLAHCASLPQLFVHSSHIDILKYLRILRWRTAVWSQVEYHSNDQIWSRTLACLEA